jgi:4a-hydroxytetrahydrobiopterin dehydratase
MFQEQNNALVVSLRFKDFIEAFAFMTEVAFVAEKQQHHPNWENVWNTVHISLCTHDAGNTVTDRDHRLARSIETIARRRGAEVVGI